MIGDNEDFLLPRRTETPRPLPEEDRQVDEEYFRNKLHNALKIPETRSMDDKTAALIRETFVELGIQGFRPWRDLLIIRTNPIPKKTGSIYLPEKLTSFYGELPHLQPITGIAIAVGPKATVKPGDQVAFMRLHFARWLTIGDGTVVGWIQEAHVDGYVDLDPGDTFADLRVENSTPRRLHG